MKFQNPSLNFFERTEAHTDKPKAICSPLFQSWGHNNQSFKPLARFCDYTGWFVSYLVKDKFLFSPYSAHITSI